MKKIFFSTIAVLTVGLFVACGNDPGAGAAAGGGTAPGAGGGGGGATAVINLTLPESHPEGHPAVAGHHEFVRLVEERSNGEITVSLFSGGVLGGEAATMEQVQLGAHSLMRISSVMLSSIDEAFNVLGLPYIWTSRESMLSTLDGEVGDFFAERLLEHGLYILAWHDPGARSFYNNVRPIHYPSDLEGLSIRVQESELMMNLATTFGAFPTPMAWAEVYTALSTGVVDGAENNFPSLITAAHHEVVNYFTINEHSILPEPVIINLALWQSLSTEHQDIVRQAAIDGALVQRAEWLLVDEESEQTAIEAGVQIHRLTPSQRQAFTDAVLPLYDDFVHLQYYIDMIRNAQN